MLEPPWTWINLHARHTEGWWALELAGERLALLQPFQGRIQVRFYTGIHPWQVKDVSAPTTDQAKRFAERWLLPRISARGMLHA